MRSSLGNINTTEAQAGYKGGGVFPTDELCKGESSSRDRVRIQLGPSNDTHSGRLAPSGSGEEWGVEECSVGEILVKVTYLVRKAVGTEWKRV